VSASLLPFVSLTYRRYKHEQKLFLHCRYGLSLCVHCLDKIVATVGYMNQAYPKHKKTVILLILGLLSAIGPFSIDMYLPAFDTIARNFDTSVDHVQLSLTSYFIGIALGQLVYGPLLDKFGRKKPLMMGLLIYMITSI